MSMIGRMGPWLARNDPLFDKVKLLMHFEAANNSPTFVDVKGHTLNAVGNAQHTTSSPLVGVSSGSFDGADSYVWFGNDSGLRFNNINTPFTVEAVSSISASHNGAIFSNYSSPSVQYNFLLTHTSGGKLRAVLYQDLAGAVAQDMTTTGSVPTGQTNYLALAYDGTNFYLSINGVVETVARTITAFSSGGNFTQDHWIGCIKSGSPIFDLNGKLDELRVTIGAGACRFTGNHEIPVFPFPDY